MPDLPRMDLLDFQLRPFASPETEAYYNICKQDRSRQVVLLQVFGTFSTQKALDLMPATPFSLCYVDPLDHTQAPTWLLASHYGRAAFVHLCPEANKAQIAELWQMSPPSSSRGSRKTSDTHSGQTKRSAESERDVRPSTQLQRKSHNPPSQRKAKPSGPSNNKLPGDNAKYTLDPSFKAMMALQDRFARSAEDSGFIEPLQDAGEASDAESESSVIQKWLQGVEAVDPAAEKQKEWLEGVSEPRIE